MNYGELNSIFLAVALAVYLLAWFRRRAAPGLRAASAATLLGLLVLTAIFDNVMIGSGLFTYAGSTISGLHLGLAPLEDFAYPIAAALLLPGLWLLLTRKPKP